MTDTTDQGAEAAPEETPRAEETAPPSRGAAATPEPLGPVLSEVVDKLAAVLRTRGKAFLEVSARKARQRMDLFQARRDLDQLHQKLGREVVRLVEAGEITHPGLVKGVERIYRQQESVTQAEEAARSPGPTPPPEAPPAGGGGE